MDNNLMDNNTPEGGAKKRTARGGDSASGKRSVRREEIRKAQQRQRLIVIGGIIVAIALVVGFLILPAANKVSGGAEEVGDFIRVTPEAYKDADGYKLGNPNAKAKIEVFEDFMCSACMNYSQNVEPQVIKELVDSGQAYYVMYQFPFLDTNLPTKDSTKAANAALCAADQNKYWQFKQFLFANSDERAGVFSDARLKAFAEAAGLDMTQFNSCYDNKQHQSEVDQQKALGTQYNVNGTPSLFVNGVQVAPGKVPSFEDIAIAVANASK